MRKNEEGLEKDLRTLGRIEKFYNVEENLVSKAKGYLINHQHNIDQLTPEEENRLLGKLNEELRGCMSSPMQLFISNGLSLPLSLAFSSSAGGVKKCRARWL